MGFADTFKNFSTAKAGNDDSLMADGATEAKGPPIA
jgi:hypothetical protein